MNLGGLIRHCEFANPRRYNGVGEVAVALIGCVLWFGAIVVRLGYSSETWTLTERLVEATSFLIFAAVPSFFLATPIGTRLAQKVLLKQAGFLFQSSVCILLGIYISSVRVLSLNLGLNPARFSWLKRLESLIIPSSFWLNMILLLIGSFIVLRIPFLLLAKRNSGQRTSTQASISSNHRSNSLIRTIARSVIRNIELVLLLVGNSIYIILVQTSLISGLRSESSGYYIAFAYTALVGCLLLVAKQPSPSHRLNRFDILLTAICLLSLFWFSRPNFSFGVFISLTLFILVIIHGSGLGREHFGYSFQVRSFDWLYTLKLIAIAVLMLVPTAILLKFADPATSAIATVEGGFHRSLFFLSYAVLFSFRVGVFEEVLFRSGLMVILRDQFQRRLGKWSDRAGAKMGTHPQWLVLTTALIGSIIFGLLHIGNEPRSSSTISTLEYKSIYMMLATVASMFYSIAFGETNRLWCSIVIHGVVDTTAVVLLGAALTVPF